MILIVGAGAVGTILATHLAAAGRDVGLYARPKDVARFGSVDRVRTDFPDAGRPALTAPRPKLITTLDLAGVGALLIGVKYPDLEALLAQLPDPIPSTCTLVSTLNGVAPLRMLRAARPAARVVPMSVMMNGQLIGPLHARLATRTEIVLGDPDPSLVAQFENTGMIVKTAHGEEAVWGKLLINLANAICALTRTTFKDLLLDPDLRRIYVAVLEETTGALDAARIRWKMPLVLPYGAYRWALLHGGPLPWWFAKYRNGVREGAYPSMVADVENARVTEVEQLNGEVVRLGRETGYPTPVNAALVELIGASRTPARLAPSELRARTGG
jgi:2-dehydropantoate 2-reductase